MKTLAEALLPRETHEYRQVRISCKKPSRGFLWPVGRRKVGDLLLSPSDVLLVSGTGSPEAGFTSPAPARCLLVTRDRWRKVKLYFIALAPSRQLGSLERKHLFLSFSLFFRYRENQIRGF